MENLQDKTVNEMQERISNYYIDFIPQRKSEESYIEVTEYFLSHYFKVYEEKMISILLKLMSCYHLGMYLTDFPLELQSPISKEYEKLVGTDLYSLEIEEWIAVVKHVIKEELASVQILSLNPRFLISINQKFTNELLRIPESHAAVIKSIVEGEGLYLIPMQFEPPSK